MAKLKDGFYKQTAEAIGSDLYVLLAGGGSKLLSDFATSSGVVTALGTNGNYVTWTKNGTANNLTVPYATKSGSLVGIYSSALPSNTFDTGAVKYYYNILLNTEGLFPHNNNANSILTVSKHQGSYLSQLGFSSDKRLYFRSANGEDINSLDWSKIAYVSEIPTKVSQLENDSDYLTSLPDHVHTFVQSKDNYTFTSSTLPNSFDYGISAGFVDSNAGFGSYGSVLTVRTYAYGGGTLQLYAPYSATYGGTRLKARFGDYDKSGGNSWTDLKEIAWTSDLANYYPLSGSVNMSGDNKWIGSTMGGGTDYWRIGGYGSSDSGICKITIGDNSNDKFQIEIADYSGTTYTPLEVTNGGIKVTGKLNVNSSVTDVLVLNTSHSTEVGIEMQMAGTRKGWFGYNPSTGMYIWNAARNKFLYYKDDGTLTFEGNTVWHAGNDGTDSGLDADKLDGYHANIAGNKPWGTIPVVNTSGWVEIGKHLEFHYDNTTGSDYSTVLACTGNYANVVSLPSATGTLALTSQIPTSLPANGGNADTASGYTLSTFGYYNKSAYLTNTSGSTWYIKIQSDLTWNSIPQKLYINPGYNNIQGWLEIDLPSYTGDVGYIVKTHDYNGCNVSGICVDRSTGYLTIHLKLVGNTSASCAIYSTFGFSATASTSSSVSFRSVNSRTIDFTKYAIYANTANIASTLSAGNIIVNGDWSTDFGIYLNEGGDTKYGFSLLYGESDLFKLITRHEGIASTVFSVGRGSTQVDFKGVVNAPAFTVNGASSAGTNYITGTAGRIFFGGNFHLDSLGSNATYINHYTANNVYMCSGSSQGKVGIGTSSPAHKLDVRGRIFSLTSDVDGVIIKRQTAGSGAFIRYLSDNQDAKGWRVGMLGTQNDFTFEYSNDTFSTTSQKLCISKSGGLISPGHVVIKGSTSNVMTYDGNVHGALCFENSDSSQNVRFIFTDYDSYRQPAGIKLIGNQGGEWFEVDGSIYGSGFVKHSSSNSYVLLGGGGHKALSDFSMAHSHPYLPLVGGTLTGTLEFNDTSSARLSPMIKFGSNNQDTILWKVYSSDNTYANQGVFGFDMTYKGTGSGDGNTLILHSDNQNASSKVAVMTITQAGIITLGKPLTGKLSLPGGSYSWYQVQQFNSSNANPSYYSADCAIININSYTGWQPWIRGVDSENGSWTIGQYTTCLHIGYIPKTNTSNTLTYRWDFNKNGSTTLPGNVTATHFYESSDAKLKENIQSIINSDNIPKLRQFNWKSDGSKSYGLIAQELEEQGYSELVSNEGNHKTVNYSAALSLIVAKLQNKIKELESEIETLKLRA